MPEDQVVRPAVETRHRLERLVDALCAPLYRVTLGTAALLVWGWAVTRWLTWDAGYDVYFWGWLFSLLALWLSPQLPDAKRADVLLVILWLGAVSLRCWNLFTIPADSGILMTSETITPILDVDNIFRSLVDGTYANVFHTRWGVYLAPNAIAYKITWDLFTAFRGVAVFWGALALAGAAVLARRLDGPPLAYAVLVFIGLNWWDNSGARVHPIMSAACGAAWTWWAVWRACSTSRAADAVLAGLIAGLALRLYEPAKIILIVVPAWWLYHAVVTGGFARRTWRSIALIGATSLMAIWPLLTHGASTYFFEAPSNALLYGEHLHDEFRTAPLQHMARTLNLFTGNRVDALVNTFVDAPVLNPVEIGLLLIGLLAACWRWREPNATIAPIWFAATLFVVSVSSQPEAARRLSVAMPAVGILAATGFLQIFRWRRPWGLLACALILALDVYLNWHWFTVWAVAADRTPQVIP